MLTLRLLILLLAFSASLITFASSFYSTYQVQKAQLIKDTLRSNYAYANKLASATDKFLEASLQQLAYAAKEIAANINDDAFLEQQVKRLNLQTNSFNTVVINRFGVVVATSPEKLSIRGRSISTEGVLQALKEKKPLISKPYMAATGNLIISISYPLFDDENKYLGYVGGTIYLKERNIISELLEHHYHEGGAYTYVVDSDRRILYHPDNSRIGEKVTRNLIIDALIRGESGQQAVINSQNINMLAGYAPVKLAKWGVVAQRSLDVSLASLDSLIIALFRKTLPMALIMFTLIAILAHFISRPLQQLAISANTLDDADTIKNLNNINAWYFESQKLKLAILNGVNTLQEQLGQLRHDAQTDPLTGVHNRRSLNIALSKLMIKKIPFAILEIDIDYFKRVNDDFGHDTGDRALKALTSMIESIARKEDIIARIGGEEFVLVLPNENDESAYELAEQLRINVESTEIDIIGSITISVGIASWPTHSSDIDQVYKCADKALYHAKEHGRNQCVVASLD